MNNGTDCWSRAALLPLMLFITALLSCNKNNDIDPSKGVLLCTTYTDSTLYLGIGPGVYHSYDYPFYYFNLRENAGRRTDTFEGER